MSGILTSKRARGSAKKVIVASASFSSSSVVEKERFWPDVGKPQTAKNRRKPYSKTAAAQGNSRDLYRKERAIELQDLRLNKRKGISCVIDMGRNTNLKHLKPASIYLQHIYELLLLKISDILHNAEL